MALTDTFVKNVKRTGSSAGDKQTNGSAIFLLVNAGGKYWRMNYRIAGKQRLFYSALFRLPSAQV
ncbi:MAG: Arm DNA-binding domain-containing protein [Rhodoferax sp.]|nr:Arm DNA-binding domain-containing protein [Rhodoferax sp.]